jgi:hypothetical protein
MGRKRGRKLNHGWARIARMGIDTEQKGRVRRTIEDEEEDEKEKDHLQWAWPFSEKETKGRRNSF